MKYLFLVVCGVFLLQNTLYAEELKLEQAVEEARHDSPKLLKSESFANEAAWKRNEGLSNFLPSVTASASHLLDQKYVYTDIAFPGASSVTAVPGIVPATNFVLNAQLPLFDGFATFYRYASVRSNARAATHEYDWAKFSLEHEVILQFYRALGSKILKDVAAQNLKMLEDHLKDVRLLKSAGISTNYDVLRVEVQTSEARSELMNAVDNEEISRSHLGEVLGRKNESRELVGSLPILAPSLIQSLGQDNERSDLKALDFRVVANDQSHAALSMYWFPKFYLFGQYQYYNNRSIHIRDADAYRSAYQVGIGLSWNIFDGFASYSRSRQGEEQAIQAEQSRVAAQLKATQDMEVWRRKFLYFCNVYNARTDDVEKSTESVRLAKEGRKVGSRTNTDLLDAESELSRARAGVVNAQLGAIEALINLELAAGHTLYSFK